MNNSNIATNSMIITIVVCILLIIISMVLSSTITLAFGLLGLLVPMYIAEVYIDDSITEGEKTNQADKTQRLQQEGV